MKQAGRIRKKIQISTVIIHLCLILIAVFMLIPFYWMIVNSLKTAGDFYGKPETIFITNPTFENYVNLFTKSLFPNWLYSSLIVSIMSTLLGLAICSMAGFAFGVYKFRLKKTLIWAVLCSVAIPEIVTAIPVFRMMANFGLIDKYSSLVLPYAVSMFGIFLMKQYMESSLPYELVEAARIDGLSEKGIFMRIALPLSTPGLGVLGIYLWLSSWSGYFWPLLMLKSRVKLTVPLGLATLYSDPWNLEYGMLMAGALFATIPIVLVFLFAQEQFITGLTSGSVKG